MNAEELNRLASLKRTAARIDSIHDCAQHVIDKSNAIADELDHAIVAIERMRSAFERDMAESPNNKRDA